MIGIHIQGYGRFNNEVENKKKGRGRNYFTSGEG